MWLWLHITWLYQIQIYFLRWVVINFSNIVMVWLHALSIVCAWEYQMTYQKPKYATHRMLTYIFLHVFRNEFHLILQVSKIYFTSFLIISLCSVDCWYAYAYWTNVIPSKDLCAISFMIVVVQLAEKGKEWKRKAFLYHFLSTLILVVLCMVYILDRSNNHAFVFVFVWSCAFRYFIRITK